MGRIGEILRKYGVRPPYRTAVMALLVLVGSVVVFGQPDVNTLLVNFLRNLAAGTITLTGSGVITLPNTGSIVPASGTFSLGSSNVTVGTTGILTSHTSASFADAYAMLSSSAQFHVDGAVVGPCWNSTSGGTVTVASPGTCDTGFARNTAGVVEVNTGTPGTFAPIIASQHIEQGANGQKSIIQEATAQVTCNGGGATCTFTNLIPAGSIVFGVDSRVTTILTGAALTTWKLGDGTTTNAFANTQALASGTVSDFTTHLSTWKPTLYTAATSVVMTANAGVFSTGAVRVTVHYISLTAATS